MALSASQDFKLTRDNLIKRSLELVGARSENEEPSSFEINSAADFLNMLIKHWQSKGLHLWVKKEITVFLEQDKQSYSLGTGSYATYDADYVETQLDGALVASDTAVTVDSTTGMAASDNIGIHMAGGTIHWDTIASVDTSTTLTLTTGMAAAASDDAYVRSYTNKAWRPLQILQATVKDTSGNEIPMQYLSMQEYYDLPNKASTGTSINYYYDPQLTDGKLYVWPTMSADGYELVMQVVKQFDDMDAANNDFEIPQEWFLALVYNLALLLADSYDVPQGKYYRIRNGAEKFLRDVEMFDEENVSIFFRPAPGRH